MKKRGMVTLIDIVGAFNCTPYAAIEGSARKHGINDAITKVAKRAIIQEACLL